MATSAEPLEGLHCTVPTTCNSPYTCVQKKFHHQVNIWICKVLLSLRKQSTFCNRGGGWWGVAQHWSLGSDIWETIAEIPFWWYITTQIWVVLLIGCAVWEFCFSQSEVRLRSVQWHVFSMEFLRSSFRHPLNLRQCQLFPHCAA